LDSSENIQCSCKVSLWVSLQPSNTFLNADGLASEAVCVIPRWSWGCFEESSFSF